MRPAIGRLDVRTDPVRCDQAVVSGISIHLQDATEALQYPFSMLPAATVGTGEGQPRASPSRSASQRRIICNETER